MTLLNKVAQFSADSDTVNLWLNGPATGPGSTLATAGGTLRTPAKLISDKDADINAAAGGVLAQTVAAQVTATTQAVIATTNSSIAVTAKTAAEAARDAANMVGKVFITTALGIAGTTSGQSFSVLSADSVDLIVYTNAAGTATELLRFKTKVFLDSLGFDTTYNTRAGYAAAWIDSTGAMALGIRNDGRIIFGSGGDIAQRVNLLEALSFSFSDAAYNRSGYSQAWLDGAGSVAGGLDGAGNLITKGINVTQSIISNSASIAASPTRTASYEFDRNGLVWAWLDSVGNVTGGLDAAGNLITKGININDTLLYKGYDRSGYSWAVQDSAGSVAIGVDYTGNFLVRNHPVVFADGYQMAQVATNSQWVTPSGFFASGDSLTQGAGGTPYPTQLAALLGKPVTNFGIGGQTAQNISGRFGGSVPFVTITGNTIPTGGPVAVTSQTFQIHNNQGPGSVAGTLAGIPGLLNATAFNGSGIPTAVNFTRTTPGSTLVIDSSTAFIVNTSDKRQFGTVVFWYGRNNVGTATFNADVKQAIADAVGQLKTSEKRFIVMSILNSNTEIPGTGIYNDVVQINNDLRALYPRNFIDIRALLVRSGTGTGADATDLANDCPPTSLRSDAIHLNTAGYGVVANAVFNFLSTKGWFA